MNMKNRLNAHFAACAAVAAATVAVSQQSEAAVVYSGPININIPSTTAGVYLNVVTGVNNIAPASAPGWDVNPWSSTALNMFTSATGNGANLAGGGAYVGTAATYFNLTVGTVVGAASTFGNTGTDTIAASTPLNLNSSNNYVGFRFWNESTSAIHYGWMQISLGGTAQAQPRAIVAYAYEDVAGASITVPTPGGLALLGMAGLVGNRRRRVA